MKCVMVCSGGMDSVTALAMAAALYDSVDVLTFNYGQRHMREIECAQWQANRYQCRFDVVQIPVGHLLTGSSLTDVSESVPHGHYSEESMRRTVVPGRNAMMLSIAFGIAAARGAKHVGTAVHAGDHYIYPDCRPQFIGKLQHALRLGTTGHRDPDLRLWTPFLNVSKVEILRIGHRLGVDYGNTWTCYEGGEQACGRCGSCNERLEAFTTIGETDPLRYAA